MTMPVVDVGEDEMTVIAPSDVYVTVIFLDRAHLYAGENGIPAGQAQTIRYPGDAVYYRVTLTCLDHRPLPGRETG